jgi:hypothetical protein
MMRYIVASIFIVCGLFFLIAAQQIARDTLRTPSMIGEIPPGGARILGAGVLILGLICLVY